MSLKLWLPLTQDNHNQGNSTVVMTGNPNSWGQGKIGEKCATFNNNTANVIYCDVSDFNYVSEDFSWCLWLNKNYAAITANAMWAFTCGRADAGSRGYGLRINSATQVGCFFGTQSWNMTVNDNEWHHIAFTKKGTTICLYLDGVLKSTNTFTGTYPTYIASEAHGVGVGCFHYSGNIYPLIGSINDFRIYNHSLSLKEVKELAKGLCLHYKLDSEADNGLINLVSGTAAEGKATSTGGFTITKLANEPGYNYYYTRTGTSANYWPNFCMATVDRTKFTSGKPYIWSCKVRVYTNDFAGFTMRKSLIGNDYTHGGAGFPAGSTNPEWKTLSALYNPIPDSFTQNSTTYYLSSNYAPRMEFFAGNQNTSGKVYTLSADIKDVQIVEATTVQDWSEITYPTSCCDCGGLNYKDLKPVNKLSATTDSPVYEKSKYTQGVGYYKNDSLNMKFNELSISFWYKPNATISAQHFVFGMFDNWTNNGISIFRNSDGATNLRCSTATTGTASASATNSLAVEGNKWNHIVMTWCGGASKNYLNGTLSGSTTVGTTASYIECPVLYIGNSKYQGTPASETDEAYFSDFRVYAKCLDSADVQELYKTRASIDNGGNVYAYEYKET